MGIPALLARMQSSSLILALDIGTSSTRTALFDTHANRLPGVTAQQTYPLVTSVDGAAELEPGVLLSAVRRCLEQTMHHHRAAALRGRPIVGIGVSCFWHSLVGCDARGTALTNIITWADSRCREDAAKLREELPEKQVHARTGCMLRASFWPAKLRWLRRAQKRKFTAVKQWISPAEWIQRTLAGEANCAIGMATGTGLFNPEKLAWDEELLKACDISPEKLGALSDEPTPVGSPLASQFPELKGVPWFPGIGDGATSNLGSGATRHGLAAINVGTSAAFRVMRSDGEARAPFGLFCYRVDAQRFLIGGAVSNAGNLRAWCLRELKLEGDAELEAELAKRPGPAHGLTVLPFWTAERAPTWNEDATGTIHGLTQHTTALDLLQAITEASYQRIARIAELIPHSGKGPLKIIVSGGIQRSPAALQRLADVLGHTIHPNDEMEASIRGAAILALEKLGFPAPAASLGSSVKPRAKYAKLYAAERERERALESQLPA
jgi:gluconokinase